MGELVLLCGRDPFAYKGGSESFERAVGLLARDLGLRAHFFAVSNRTRVTEHEEGTLHLVRSAPGMARAFNAALHRPALQRALTGFLARRPGPHVIHAFGAWGEIGHRARDALRARGVAVELVTTAWMAIEHETLAKLDDAEAARFGPVELLHRFELWLTRWWSGPYEARGYRASRHVLVNYESVRGFLRDYYGDGIAVRRITYTPPTAWDALPPRVRAEPPLILTMSRHDGRKGLDVLIAALARLRDRGVAFRACLPGGGVLLGAHREQVRRLGLEDRVELPGRVPAVMPYLRRADVFVLPSTQEGSGSVAVLEALQAGCAIVSTDVDGMPEDLTDERDALLVAPSDPVALAEALERLLADPALRERLGTAARATYEARFSPEAAAADLGAVYAELGLPARAIAAATRATSAAVTDGPDGR